jgi:prolipoprotein diacylglyceryl transferase
MLAAIPPPPLTSLHLGPLRITVFGVLVAVAVLVGVLVTRRFAADGGDPELADRVLFPAIVVGFLGARLAYIVTHTGRYQGRWLEVFAVWQGGLALFGGLTFGTLTAILLVRRYRGDLGAFAGAAALGIPLAQAIGRPADYFSQELYGTPSSLPWAVEVPERFRPAAYADATTFHPAFFYEALWSLATVAVLLLLELIRTDTTFRLLGVSRNGGVALALVVGGTVGLAYRRYRRPAGGSDALRPTPTPATH